jgi:hypothetical protein
MKRGLSTKALSDSAAQKSASNRELPDCADVVHCGGGERAEVALRADWCAKAALRVVITVVHLALGAPVACASAPSATSHGNEETIYNPPHPGAQSSEVQKRPVGARNAAHQTWCREPKTDRGGGHVQAS